MDESPIKGYVLKVMNVLTVLMALVALTAGGLGVYWGSYEPTRHRVCLTLMHDTRLASDELVQPVDPLVAAINVEPLHVGRHHDVRSAWLRTCGSATRSAESLCCAAPCPLSS
jgi:hypothetical protein